MTREQYKSIQRAIRQCFNMFPIERAPAIATRVYLTDPAMEIKYIYHFVEYSFSIEQKHTSK